jgi:hypothetical protein
VAEQGDDLVLVLDGLAALLEALANLGALGAEGGLGGPEEAARAEADTEVRHGHGVGQVLLVSEVVWFGTCLGALSDFVV